MPFFDFERIYWNSFDSISINNIFCENMFFSNAFATVRMKYVVFVAALQRTAERKTKYTRNELISQRRKLSYLFRVIRESHCAIASWATGVWVWRWRRHRNDDYAARCAPIRMSFELCARVASCAVGVFHDDFELGQLKMQEKSSSECRNERKIANLSFRLVQSNCAQLILKKMVYNKNCWNLPFFILLSAG